MSARLFVYYRVQPGKEAATVRAMRTLQARWSADLNCELLKRDGDASDGVTLMEIYRAEGGVSADWQARIEAEALAAMSAWLIGERHVERFVPCA
jgi:hypothetical protein